MKEAPSIPLRIALHRGEVLMEGNEVYGGAINLVSRILKYAIPESILVSDDFFGSLAGEEAAKLHSLGHFQLKYVEREVEIFAREGANLRIPEISLPEKTGEIHSRSLAVMPFIDLGAGVGQAYIGQGISEAIINALAKLKGVSVISRSSSFAFSKLGKDLKEAGSLLGVSHVLEGSAQRSGEKIRITAQLIDCRTGFHEFSESYDRQFLDLFTIQEEISWLIARKLNEELSQKEQNHVVLPRTSNVRAMEYYMKARQILSRPGKEEIQEAIQMFRKAIETDPAYVLPYAGISLSYTYLGAMRYLQEDEAYQLANQYALKAIQIDPELPEAMVVHALATFWNNNWNLINGEQIISNALRVAPGSSEIRLFYGMFTLMSGNVQDALIEVLLANKLDPLNPNILTRLAYTYLCLREFEEAHACFRLVYNSAPFAMYISYILSWSYLLQGQYERAKAALEEVDLELDVYQATFGTRGFLEARLGRPDKAYEQIQSIERMKEEGGIRFPHYNLMLVYAGLKKREQMFHHLECAFGEKPIHLMFIQADPFWEPYRQDSRYIQLVSRIFHRSPGSGKITLQSETQEELTLQTDQIQFIEAEDNYSRVVWITGGRRCEKMLRVTLNKLEDQLKGTEIIRCHRSYLVNHNHFRLTGDSRGYRLISSKSPESIPVSRSRSGFIKTRLSS